jgi:large-conductance mechanosensitive channel
LAQDFFSQVLNFLIPVAIWIFIAWTLYKAFQKPLDQMVEKYREWKDSREPIEQEVGILKNIEYE